MNNYTPPSDDKDLEDILNEDIQNDPDKFEKIDEIAAEKADSLQEKEYIVQIGKDEYILEEPSLKKARLFLLAINDVLLRNTTINAKMSNFERQFRNDSSFVIHKDDEHTWHEQGVIDALKLDVEGEGQDWDQNDEFRACNDPGMIDYVLFYVSNLMEDVLERLDYIVSIAIIEDDKLVSKDSKKQIKNIEKYVSKEMKLHDFISNIFVIVSWMVENGLGKGTPLEGFADHLDLSEDKINQITEELNEKLGWTDDEPDPDEEIKNNIEAKEAKVESNDKKKE